jgi:hypothetical protein
MFFGVCGGGGRRARAWDHVWKEQGVMVLTDFSWLKMGPSDLLS